MIGFTLWAFMLNCREMVCSQRKEAVEYDTAFNKKYSRHIETFVVSSLHSGVNGIPPPGNITVTSDLRCNCRWPTSWDKRFLLASLRLARPSGTRSLQGCLGGNEMDGTMGMVVFLTSRWLKPLNKNSLWHSGFTLKKHWARSETLGHEVFMEIYLFWWLLWIHLWIWNKIAAKIAV